MFHKENLKYSFVQGGDTFIIHVNYSKPGIEFWNAVITDFIIAN